MESLFTWRRSYGFVLLATLLVVMSADFFLYGHTLGWTAAIVAAAMLVTIAVRNSSFLRTTGGRIFTLAAVGLLFALIEQPTWFNITYALLCLAVLALTNSLGWESNFWPWIVRGLRWLATGWGALFLDNGIAMRWMVRHGISPRIARAIAAWTVPLLLSSVFVALFAWANPIISQWFGKLGDLISNLLAKLPDLLSVPRLAFWLLFATTAWMLLRGRARRRRHTVGATPNVVDENKRLADVPVALVVRCLILFNIVFAVENVLDLRYLYAPSEPVSGTVYKQYVRRGAYPLVAAALLAGGFVLVTFRPKSETENSPAARKLVYVWIGQTILLTVSAATRLERYVELTELTRLRVASTIWFFLVAMGLMYIIWRIVQRRGNAWLINVNAVTALIVLYPCCFVNFDGLIARYNAAHCREAGGSGMSLDIEYIRTLGTPALAALDSVSDKITIPWRKSLADKVSTELREQLAGDLSDWRSWTWRRHRTARAVEEIRLAKARGDQQLAILPDGQPAASGLK